MAREEALYEAKKASATLPSSKEDTRNADIVGWVDVAPATFRYALSHAGRSPGFTPVAVLTLALGNRANHRDFLFHQFRSYSPVPYHDPASLAMVWETNSQHRNPHKYRLSRRISSIGRAAIHTFLEMSYMRRRAQQSHRKLATRGSRRPGRLLRISSPCSESVPPRPRLRSEDGQAATTTSSSSATALMTGNLVTPSGSP